MEFLSKQTFTCRENVSVWTERQTDKIGNDILDENVTLPLIAFLQQPIIFKLIKKLRNPVGNWTQLATRYSMV
jgi:hypothetical protein